MVEVEQEYTCARWAPGTELVHGPSRRPIVIVGLEFQGWWLGHTARDHPGHERFMVIPMYRVRVPHLHEERLMHAYEMREA
jgi:hypothetical protein